MDLVENSSKLLFHVSSILKKNPREWNASTSFKGCKIVSDNTQISTARVSRTLHFDHIPAPWRKSGIYVADEM